MTIAIRLRGNSLRLRLIAIDAHRHQAARLLSLRLPQLRRARAVLTPIVLTAGAEPIARLAPSLPPSPRSRHPTRRSDYI